MDNPLLTRQFRIPFDRIGADDVEPAMHRLVREAERAVEAIASQPGSPTYASTLGALEEATETLEWAATVIGHLESVATTPAFRAAYQAIQPTLSRFWTGLVLNEALWDVLRRYADTAEAAGLDPIRRRHLDKTLDDFRRHGADLDPSGKQRLQEINVELADLTTVFAQHVLDATNAFELVVEDEDRLAGLPQTARDAARESAVRHGRSGWRFTLQAPSLQAALTYLEDRALRRKIWEAHNRRGAAPPFDNLPVIQRVLALRREKATLLGYANFADLVLADRMAGTGAAARTFIDDLRERTRGFFERENAELEAFRRATFPDIEGPIAPWDLAFLAERLRRARYDFDEEALRPYFPVDRVIDGLFRTIGRLYGVEVEETRDLPVWDPAVRTFRLLDVDGSHLGSFYLDLYPRENKRDGAWMNALLTGRPGQPHLGLFCANATPPVGKTPALLTHGEVETLFHEFGHLMHHLLSQVPVRSLAGTNVAWDWVELPSQIMENWCWEREALDLFARHYRTGEPIPEDLFARLQRTRTFRAANAQMRQIGFATLDLALHCDYDPADPPDLPVFAREILQQHSPARLPDDYGFIGGFSHLFANPVGYAAGYYSYKWSEVLDADAFTRFRDEGIFNPEVGAAFRHTILERGDSAAPLELYREFMGRDPDPEPLFVRQGLTRSA